MKREYREINLEKFVPEEEEKLTKTEKEHIILSSSYQPYHGQSRRF